MHHNLARDGSNVCFRSSVTRLANQIKAPTVSRNVAVIPEDVNGEYEVILESSTDMITWSPANPGNYGGNTAGRFFRIRMEKTN